MAISGKAPWSGGSTSARHSGGPGSNPVDFLIFRPITKNLFYSKVVKKGCNRKLSEEINCGRVWTEKRRWLKLNTEETKVGENLITINDDCIVLYHCRKRLPNKIKEHLFDVPTLKKLEWLFLRKYFSNAKS